MHLFYSLIKLHGEMSIDQNYDKIHFTDTMGVYYQNENEVYDYIGSILEVTLLENSTEVYGFFYNTGVARKIISMIRGNKLRPIFTGMVLGDKKRIDKIIIDGFSLEEIDEDIGSKISMIRPIYN